MTSMNDLMHQAKSQLLKMNQSTNKSNLELDRMLRIVPEKQCPVVTRTPKKDSMFRPHSSDRLTTQVKRGEMRSLSQRVDSQINKYKELHELFLKAKALKTILPRR